MSTLNNRNDSKSEKYLQNQVINNKKIQKYIIDNLGFDFDESIKFKKGKTYLNKILPDIKIVKKNEILSLVECKGSNINVTDYVRGIGQLFQYEYFAEQNIVEKNTNDFYSRDFKTLYLYPSEVIRNNDFNVSNFKYPSSIKILQVNLENLLLREFTEDLKQKFSSLDENLIAISEYYFRDNRIFELYILLKFLEKNYLNSKQFLNRASLENQYLRKFNTPNNNNWRNAFISLNGLGFINEKNLLSVVGKDVIKLNYYDFCYFIYESYIKAYVEIIMPKIIENPNIKLIDLREKIKEENNNRDILFLTESETRYLSSWLNIFRDDYGFIDFKPRSNQRVINYNPLELQKNDFINQIIKYTKAKDFLSKI